MSKVLDKEFFKQRSKLLTEMAKKRAPEAYFIERFHIDGTYTSTKIESTGTAWKRLDTATDLSVTECEVPLTGSLKEILLSQADTISIGPEITFLHCPQLDLAELMGILVPLTPELTPEESAWSNLPVAKIWNSYKSDFDNPELKISDLHSNPIEVQLSLVVVNGSRLATVKSGGVTGYLPLDSQMDSEWPLITKGLMLDFWYSCGSGPPSWEGRTSFGEAGPNFYASITQGDLEPEIRICPLELVDRLEDLIEINIINCYGGLEAFLLHQIGLPDLPDNPYHQWLSTNIEHEGHFVYLFADDDLKQSILNQVELTATRGKLLADSLRDSSTPLGQQIYALLPKVVETGSNWEIIEVLRAAQDQVRFECF